MTTPLRLVRMSLGLTQSQLARLVQVTQPHISALECGVQRPSPELAARLAEALGRHVINEEQLLYPERFSPAVRMEEKAGDR
ncbi:MAG: helix-turn-helix transcriptional regulator [Proteobacteria bacterium]|nr:helix-turn-helix transcriptional regulator [Pseudomonadota bacterium]